jgi:hypothetical protein
MHFEMASCSCLAFLRGDHLTAVLFESSGDVVPFVNQPDANVTAFLTSSWVPRSGRLVSVSFKRR